MTGGAGVAKGVEGGHFSSRVGQNLQSILSVENDLIQSGGAGVAEIWEILFSANWSILNLKKILRKHTPRTVLDTHKNLIIV